MDSNGVSNGAEASSQDLLYHIKCEIIDYHTDASGLTRTHDIYGTYTSLPLAKEAAQNCLREAGYEISDFAVYSEKTSLNSWTYGEDVLIYAKAPAGQEFRVRIDVTPNTLGVAQASTQGEIDRRIYYVLQTMIDYNTDRTGGSQTSNIEGVYLEWAAAVKAAYEVLLDEDEGVTRESFAEYDRLDENKDDWPYGESVLVHAVGKVGENFKVEVKTRVKVHHDQEVAHRH